LARQLSAEGEWEDEFADLLGVRLLTRPPENVNHSAFVMHVDETEDGDVGNFNQNAAPEADGSTAEITTVEGEVGMGSNEVALGADSGGEKLSDQQATSSQAERSAVEAQAPSGDVTQVGATRSTEVDTSGKGLAPSQENGASSKNVLSPPVALAAKTRFRRCVAEDFQWCLKTVPNLDELVAQEIVSSFAGENCTSRHST
jgi:hypothetical protein